MASVLHRLVDQRQGRPVRQPQASVGLRLHPSRQPQLGWMQALVLMESVCTFSWGKTWKWTGICVPRPRVLELDGRRKRARGTRLNACNGTSHPEWWDWKGQPGAEASEDVWAARTEGVYLLSTHSTGHSEKLPTCPVLTLSDKLFSNLQVGE